MDFFKVLNGGIGVSMSNFDRLWAKKFSGWPETELTGLLPLTFLSEGSALTDYRIYGTENGAGVQTENKANPDNVELITLNNKYGVKITDAGTWQVKAFDNVYAYIYARVYDSNNEWVGDSTIIVGSTNIMYSRTITLNEGDTLCIFDPLSTSTEQDAKNKIRGDKIVAIKSDTTPATFIPLGYKIPILNTSGEQQSNYSLYIGDSKLGEEEYVDYGEQKVYKRTENLWDINNLDMGGSNPEMNVSGNSLTIKGNSNATNYYYSLTLFPAGTYTFLMTTSYRSCYIVIGSDSSISNVTLDGNSFFDSPAISNILGTNYGGYRQYNSFGIDATTIISDVPFYLGLAPFVDSFTASNTMLVQGSTAPQSYIPYLQPTDPPVPLPAISTYQGKNTLSSEETVGEVSVTGKIKEAP